MLFILKKYVIIYSINYRIKSFYRKLFLEILMKRTKNKVTIKEETQVNKKNLSSISTDFIVQDIENNITCISKEENQLSPNIIEHIKNIQKMRESNDAPVDTMGCHMLADLNADPKVYIFCV